MATKSVLAKKSKCLRNAYALPAAVALCIVLSIGVVAAIIAFSLEERQDEEPGRVVFGFLAHLPTSSWLYVLVGLIALLGLAIFWYRFEDSKSDFPGSHEHGNTGPAGSRDLFVVTKLRQRALALRTRGGAFLASSIMLLLGGVYTTIWVVPIVPSYDVQEEVRALLQLKYVGILDAIRKGNYWFYAANVPASDSPSLRARHGEEGEIEVFFLDVNDDAVLVSGPGLDWQRQGTVTGPDESAKRRGACQLGVEERFGNTEYIHVVDGDGSRPSDSAYRVFDNNGRHGVAWETSLVASVEGVGQTSGNRAEWRRHWARSFDIETIEFEAKGQHGLIGTNDGAIRVTADGGENWKTWSREDVGLGRFEWAVGAVIGNDGPRVVVGDEGTVRIRSGDEWAAPKGLDDWSFVTLVAAVEFDVHGLRHVVGTRDGSVYMTADLGESWATWRRQEVGFDLDEWAVAAVIGREGSPTLVSQKRTVRVWDGDRWVEPEDLDDWPAVTLVTAVEFGAVAQHRLVGTEDGSVHVTEDGGKNWAMSTSFDVGFNPNEWAIGAVIDSNGLRAVVGDEGTVRIRDGGRWTAPDGVDEWPPVTAIESIGDDRQVLVRSGPVVYTTEDCGENWILSKELSNAPPLRLRSLEVDGDNVWWSSDNTVWTRGDGNWEQLRPGFENDESIAAVTRDKKGGDPIVIGGRGATLIGGQSELGYGDFALEGNDEMDVLSAATTAGRVFILVRGDREDTIYVRRELPEDLVTDNPLVLVRNLPEGSRLRRDLVADIPELATLESRHEQDDPTLIDMLGVSQVHWLRAVATLATIYLVQLFVGLYRYSVRLASFWDSRADAVLLGTDFSDSNPSFDGLIAALGPDALDFKPPRYPYFAPMGRPYKPGESR